MYAITVSACATNEVELSVEKSTLNAASIKSDKVVKKKLKPMMDHENLGKYAGGVRDFRIKIEIPANMLKIVIDTTSSKTMPRYLPTM